MIQRKKEVQPPIVREVQKTVIKSSFGKGKIFLGQKRERNLEAKNKKQCWMLGHWGKKLVGGSKGKEMSWKSFHRLGFQTSEVCRKKAKMCILSWEFLGATCKGIQKKNFLKILRNSDTRSLGHLEGDYSICWVHRTEVNSQKLHPNCTCCPHKLPRT